MHETPAKIVAESLKVILNSELCGSSVMCGTWQIMHATSIYAQLCTCI